jgi:hypothetical protein
MVRVGIHGVNIHTFPGAGYELFRITHSSGRWQAVVSPEYYGLMLFAHAAPAGSRVLTVQTAPSGTLHVWATRARGGTIRVLAVNTGDRARVVSVAIAGARPGRGSLERLTAPSVSAGRGVALGGESFASPTFTGHLARRPRVSKVAAVGGRYAVALPAASAALLVVSPPAAGST